MRRATPATAPLPIARKDREGEAIGRVHEAEVAQIDAAHALGHRRHRRNDQQPRRLGRRRLPHGHVATGHATPRSCELARSAECSRPCRSPRAPDIRAARSSCARGAIAARTARRDPVADRRPAMMLLPHSTVSGRSVTSRVVTLATWRMQHSSCTVPLSVSTHAASRSSARKSKKPNGGSTRKPGDEVRHAERLEPAPRARVHADDDRHRRAPRPRAQAPRPAAASRSGTSTFSARCAVTRKYAALLDAKPRVDIRRVDARARSGGSPRESGCRSRSPAATRFLRAAGSRGFARCRGAARRSSDR